MVELTKPFLNHLVNIELTRGRLGLITYVKSTRSAFLNYLSNNKEKVQGIGLTKDGIPRALGPLIPKIRGFDSPSNFHYLQWLTTILFSTRSLKCGKSLSLESIEQPASTQVPSSICKYTKDF